MDLFIFFHYMVLLIKYNLYWGLIRQKSQEQINKDNNHKNMKILYYNYKVGDKVVLKP